MLLSTLILLITAFLSEEITSLLACVVFDIFRTMNYILSDRVGGR